MSLMNDALRKKNRETAPSLGTQDFSEVAMRPRPTRKWWAVLTAAALITAAALAGIHLWQSNAGGSLLMKSQPSRLSRQPLHPAAKDSSLTERPADVQSEPAPNGEDLPATGKTAENPASTGQLSPAAVSAAIETNAPPETDTTLVSGTGPAMAGPMTPPAPHEPATTGDSAGTSPDTSDTASRAFEPGPHPTVQGRTSPSSMPRMEQTQPDPASSPAKPTGVQNTGEPAQPPADPDQDTDLFFKKARSYHRSGRLAEAVRFYRQALKYRPHHPAAMLNLAAATMQMGNYSDALPLLKQLEQLRPRPRGVLLNLAIAAIGEDDPELALRYLDRASEASDASPWDIRFHRALSLARMNRFPEALVLYRKAETEQPDDPRLQFNLAITCDALGLYPQALTHYEAVLRTASDRPETEKATLTQRIRTIQRYLDRATSPDKGP